MRAQTGANVAGDDLRVQCFESFWGAWHLVIGYNAGWMRVCLELTGFSTDLHSVQSIRYDVCLTVSMRSQHPTQKEQAAAA
jgi:hypothetical protein